MSKCSTGPDPYSTVSGWFRKFATDQSLLSCSAFIPGISKTKQTFSSFPINHPCIPASCMVIRCYQLSYRQEDVEAVFCCVGGGGLLAGVASFLKAVKPDIKVRVEDRSWMWLNKGHGILWNMESHGIISMNLVIYCTILL